MFLYGNASAHDSWEPYNYWVLSELVKSNGDQPDQQVNGAMLWKKAWRKWEAIHH